MFRQKHAVHNIITKRVVQKICSRRKFVVMKQLQAVEEFNIASENRKSYRSFSQTNCWCEPKFNAGNTIIADGIEGTKK